MQRTQHTVSHDSVTIKKCKCLYNSTDCHEIGSTVIMKGIFS